MQAEQMENGSWLDRPLFSQIKINWEIIIFAFIILVAIITRFYDLGTRVMSHDESLHTYFSWLLYKGRGFQHTPMMHGPFQFHLIAFIYFIFGDSDFTARIPAVLASIATIGFLWNYRRYIGRVGTIIAALLFLISPYQLYYGRYVRNEAFVALFGVITLWAVLRYLEAGEKRYLYWISIITVLHFATKETSFIYTAQILVFLGILFLNRILKTRWPNPVWQRTFLITLIFAVVLFGAAFGLATFGEHIEALNPETIAAPAIPGQELEIAPSEGPATIIIFPTILGIIFLIISLYSLLRGFAIKTPSSGFNFFGPDVIPQLRSERSLDLIILITTLILPHLAAFPVEFVGWNPLDYSMQGLIRTSYFVVPLFIISIGVGLWWNPQLWLRNAAIFYAIFTVLYTTVFTNGTGFFSGLVGSLGYWLEQQGVRRGNQPSYYYLFVQLPIYEYLPLIGGIIATYLGVKKWVRPKRGRRKTKGQSSKINAIESSDSILSELGSSGLVFALLAFWALSSIIVYTIAGEKMPWLTVHISLPLILLTAWGVGYIIEKINWKAFRSNYGFIVVLLVPMFLFSTIGTLSSLFGSDPPLQGKELPQLQATSDFLLSLITAILSAWGIGRLVKSWERKQISRVISLVLFAILALMTTRSAFLAAYTNYDDATEYLVYAHAAGGVKDVMNQVEEISERISGGLSLPVAYDDDVSWPFSWYLRNYTSARYYAANPTRDLREVPIIIVGDNNFTKIEPIVGQAYYRYDYIRMWWPNQDYFNLSEDSIRGEWSRDTMSDAESMGVFDYLKTVWKHISPFFTDPQARTANWMIWFNRDYSLYGQLTNKDMSLENWRPADLMRMYIRKDVAAQLWDYGIAPAPEEVVADPYENGFVDILPDYTLGTLGNEPGQFQAPRGIAFAEDDSIYVADSRNHRIQQISPDGTVINTFGAFGSSEAGDASGGTFNEPWDVAIGPDGMVYVADTWNHRIQKFSPTGEFITMWGQFGQAENAFAFWGPRGVAVDNQGLVYVTDTGNKRVVVFTGEGEFVAEFGGVGFMLGDMDEPVGITIAEDGRIYVADTWNQRIQVFARIDQGQYVVENSWEIAGWYGQSIDNKPYIAVNPEGHVFITDPEGFRVIEFNQDGEFIRFWGNPGTGPDSMGMPIGIGIDSQGFLWISDASNNRLTRYLLP